MSGFLLSLVVAFGLFVPGTASAGQPQGCADLEAYLTTVGEHIADRLDDLLADEGWVRDFGESSRKASAPETGILALESEDLAPILDLIAVPGEALGDIPAVDVPPIAQELHESALRYHQSMPEMLKAVNKGGSIASAPFSDSFEEAAAGNLSAQRMIRETCPSLVAEIQAFGDANDVLDLNAAITNPDSLDAASLEDLRPEGYQAMSFSLLFFVADDQDDRPTGPASDAPPAPEPRSEKQGGPRGIPKIGDAAPDFATVTFDGETFRLADQRGKVVIVNFWGSWCPPCREEMPAFQHAWENSPDDVVFVGVGSKRDSEGEAVAFAEEFGVTYPIGRDTEGGTAANGQITQDYHILVYPTTYIVDPQGNVSAIIMYGMDIDDLAGYIDQARGR